MPLEDEGEILFVSRGSLLLRIFIGAVLLVIGVWVVRKVTAQEEDPFIWIWASVWFLGGGAALVSGLWGLLVSRPRFARLGDDGLQFCRWRAPLVPWSQILEARLGPKKTQDSEGSHYTFRHPLILRLRDRSGFPDRGLRRHAFPMAPLLDGTLEWTVTLDSCPCDERELLDRINARLR
jgi:hypothetical protein